MSAEYAGRITDYVEKVVEKAAAEGYATTGRIQLQLKDGRVVTLLIDAVTDFGVDVLPLMRMGQD
jgi:hypothetical protein